MVRVLLALFLAIILANCGKNDPVMPISNMPNQPYAPAPPPGGNPLPPGFQQPSPYPNQQYPTQQYPTQQYPYQGGQFNPQQLPPGQPNQFGPFLPVHNWMQQSPQGQAYWQNLWTGWQQYANYYGYQTYSFPEFWQGYCGNYLGLGNQPWYGYMNSQFYGWMGSQPSGYGYYTVAVDPGYYWQYYSGVSYQPLNEYYTGFYGGIWF